MAGNIGIGIQKFDEIREGDCFYIDKTDFIREWWESRDPRLRLPCLPPLLQGLHPPSVRGRGDAGHASLRHAQPLFLQQAHGAHPHRSG